MDIARGTVRVATATKVNVPKDDTLNEKKLKKFIFSKILQFLIKLYICMDTSKYSLAIYYLDLTFL